MDASTIAAGAVAASQAQTQMAVAARMMKMNAEASQSVATLVETASTNMEQVAKSALADGVGLTLDMSV